MRLREVHGWRRVARWLGGTALFLVGLVVFACIGIVVTLQTDWGRELARKQIEMSLARSFSGGAKLGGFHGNPFSELVLEDLVINGPDKLPAITAKTVRVELGLLPLISHQLKVGKVIVDDLDVQLKRDKYGKLDITHITTQQPVPPRGEPKPGWSISLPSVEVHRGHVAFDSGKELIDLDKIQIDGAVKMPRSGPLDIDAAISAVWREKHLPIEIAAIVHSDVDKTTVPSALVSAGDIQIAATAVRIPRGKLNQVQGTVSVVAPAAQVAALVPNVQLPADIAVAIEAAPSAEQTFLAIHGSIGGAPVRGFARANLETKSVRGVLTAADLPLARLTHGKVEGTGGVLATIVATAATEPGALPEARGIVTVWGDLPNTPHGAAVIALDTGGTHARAQIGAASVHGLRAAIALDVLRDATHTVLERGVVIANTDDPARATGGRAPVHGRFVANLAASGQLVPSPDLRISGHVDGDQLRVQNLSAQTLHLRIDARRLPAQPIGTARIEVTDLVRGDMQLGALTIAAGNRPDGKLQVSLRSQPKQAPWLVDLDALVTTGQTIAIDLQRHLVRAAGGATWKGDTGHIVIAPDRIEVRDLESESAQGRLAVSGSYGRLTGDLAANVDGSLDLGNLNPAYHGRVDLSVAAKPGRVTAKIGASVAKVGGASLTADVAAPRQLTNPRAWSMLGRDAFDHVEVKLEGIDLAQVGQLAEMSRPMQGKIDGDVQLTPAGIAGTIKLRGGSTTTAKDAGQIDADLKFSQKDRDTAVAAFGANVQKLGKIEGSVALREPEHLFDPVAWKRLGPAVFDGANVRANDIAFEPGTLEQFGIVTNLRGAIGVVAEVAPGARSAGLGLDIYDLRGGPIAKPVSVHVEARIDDTSSRGTVAVRAKDFTIAQLAAELSLTMTQLRANPKAAKTAALHARLTLPSVPARQLMATLGNTQVTGGTVDGTVEIGGTIARPTVNAAIIARDVAVPPGTGGKPFPVMHELRIDGRWDGEAGTVKIHGDETGGGKLDISADGRPSAPDEVAASVVAERIEIAPLVAFLPGPAGALGGRLDAKIAIKGLDPRTAQLGGDVAITDGRIPIAPAVGTLFHGNIKVGVANHTLAIKADGKLGKGTVQLEGTAPLDGYSPTGGKLSLTIDNVQLIGATEPIIRGHVALEVKREDNLWHALVKLEHVKVEIPDEKGEKLKPVGAPNDVVFGGHAHEKHPAKVVKSAKPPPEHPAAIADIDLGDTRVESKEVRGNVRGKLEVSVGVPGEGIAIFGTVGLSRGDLDLFDRRYNIERAVLHFDGSIDPVIDVRITHEFPDVETITEVHGRLSKPELVMSSSPGVYSQEQLLGFLLGGEPGGDPRDATSARQKVEGAAAGLVANQIGGYVKKALPIDIDVLRYESASATSSAAVTVGTWVSRSLFLAYRQHLGARPDENSGEAEVEYWIRRRLVVQGSVGDRGYSGVDLLWRRRW